MDLHKAAIKSDFVTYVDSNKSLKTNPNQTFISKNTQNPVHLTKGGCTINKKAKCTCRCTCSDKRNRDSHLKTTKNSHLQTSSNSDINKELNTDKNYYSGTLCTPPISDYVKSFSAQNSPIHQISISQSNEPEKTHSFSKNSMKNTIDYATENEKVQEYQSNSFIDITNSKLEAPKFDLYDSPEMMDILRKLEMKSEKLKYKMDALDGLRDGILKQLENALAAEQTNISLSSSDRTDSKDSGMASISNDQTKPSQIGNKLPVKSILKKPLKQCLDLNKPQENVLHTKTHHSINLNELSEIQTGNCSNWHWQRKIPQQTLYCPETERGKCRRRSFDINSPCFSNIGYNCYSNTDLTSDQNQMELLYNENLSKKSVNQFDESIITTTSNAIDIICFLEDQLSDPPSPAPQLPDDLYFQ